MKLSIDGFLGENRAIQPILLNPQVGVTSFNQKPGRGDLRPWKSPSTVATVPAGRRTIHRMGRDVASDSQYWLSWTGIVHAVVAPNAADTAERTYYTGDGAPKWTNTTMALGSAPYPATSRELGVPAPSTAPILTGSSVAPDPDLGRYSYLVTQYMVSTLKVGDKLRVKVKGLDDQYVTLTEPSSGAGVTLASLATQLDALSGLSAAQVAATDTTVDGVKIMSDSVGSSFTVEYKYSTTTTSATDTDNPVYTLLAQASGTTTVPASVTVFHSGIVAMTPGTKLSVKVNTEPDVMVTVSAGAGTYPASVTPDSLHAALKNLAGVTVELVDNADGVSKDLKITTTAIANSYLRLRTIAYNTTTTSTDNYSVVATAAEITTATPVTETRFYVYTCVTDIGEESAPSPVSAEITCNITDTITISDLTAPSGSYGINRFRIYRTQSSNNGADFYLVNEYGTTDAAIASTLTSTVDSGKQLGEVLPTTTWLMPPTDLRFLTGLWNGMMAGISGRAVRFCEAYTYYAWPIAYEILPTNAQPVALASFGQTLVMLTNGNPSLITGSTPDAMDEAQMEFYQACIAPASAVGVGHGVVWASPDGLCYVGSGGPKLLTEGVMTRDDWQAINPSSIQGAVYERRYFGFYTQSGIRKAFIYDFANPHGMYFLDFGVDALYMDDLNDTLYVLDGVNVRKWDAGSLLTVTFKSKVHKLPKPTQAFACAEVVAETYPLTFKLYADGVLKHTQTVLNNNPFRLPPGYYAQTYQMEVSGTSAIQGVAMAHSMQEIAEL